MCEDLWITGDLFQIYAQLFRLTAPVPENGQCGQPVAPLVRPLIRVKVIGRGCCHAWGFNWRHAMAHPSIRIIRDEHAALATLMNSL